MPNLLAEQIEILAAFAPAELPVISLSSQLAARAGFAAELRPSANGLALFACAGANNFIGTVQLNAPLERHEIHVDRRPHFYTLSRVN